jgi:hypothetical protein
LRSQRNRHRAGRGALCPMSVQSRYPVFFEPERFTFYPSRFHFISAAPLHP